MNEDSRVIYECVVGSVAHGTSHEGSDIDKRGVYNMRPFEFLTGTGTRQRSVGEDLYYETARFLDLLEKGNPSVVEMLFVPEDCVITSHRVFQEKVLQNRRVLLGPKFFRACKGTAGNAKTTKDLLHADRLARYCEQVAQSGEFETRLAEDVAVWHRDLKANSNNREPRGLDSLKDKALARIKKAHDVFANSPLRRSDSRVTSNIIHIKHILRQELLGLRKA